MMASSKEVFPISGVACSQLLRNSINDDQVWLLTAIETLSDGPALELGNIWRRVQLGPVPITTKELCSMLDLARQVITLDVRLLADPSIEVMVDDGLMVICHLP